MNASRDGSSIAWRGIASRRKVSASIFVHRTGHSIGPGGKLHALGVNLDDYDTHDTRAILPRAGFSIEPGVYLPDRKFGVRIEDDVLVTRSGPQNLTAKIPKAVQDVESAMVAGR